LHEDSSFEKKCFVENCEVPRDYCQRSPIVKTAEAVGHAEIAERLLTRNALVNAPDSEGHTALWIALHAPAITTSAQKSAPVDTAAVADVLRRHGGSE